RQTRLEQIRDRSSGRLFRSSAGGVSAVNEQTVHYLWEFCQRPDARVFLITFPVLFPIALLFFYWVYRWRVHPLIVWLILSLAVFGASQIWPENRSQRREL